jgi:type VI secretion system protein ImpC
MPGKIEFDFSFGKPQPHRQAHRSEPSPTRILVLGNFHGHTGESTTTVPISKRTIHTVDIDTFDAVLTRLKPRIHLETIRDSSASLDIAIDEMDDFHPDALFRKLNIFRSMREMRKRLLDPATFAAAAAELIPSQSATDSVADTGTEEEEDRGAPPPPDPAQQAEDDSSTLERLLGRSAPADIEPPPPDGAPRPGSVDLPALIRNLVAPHVVPDADPRQDVYVDSLDAAIRAQMRAVLHHPSFQAVESVWRSVSWLVTELELGEELQLFICDLTKEELLSDLQGAADHLEESELYRLVVEQEIGTRGGRAWSLLLGDFEFGPSVDDTFLLAALGAIASQAGAPFLAGARAEMLGCHSLVESPDPSAWSLDQADQERWIGLRNASQASWLGLALPRILLRLPYGPRTDPVDSFPFDELTADPDHESFLWGNPAFACALLWAHQRLVEDGSQQISNQILEGLPAYVYTRDSTKTMQPCAEVLLTERAGQAILEWGLVPILSHRDRNAVSILRIQSLSEPPAPLEGW